MGKKTVLSDYGGSLYPIRRRTRRIKKNLLSFRCRDCKTLCYVLPRELYRAARPHCTSCGGPLEETEPSHKRHLEKMEIVAVRKEGASVKIPRKKYPTCRTCDVSFPDASSLSSHLHRNETCRQKYIMEGWWGKYKGFHIFQGTGQAYASAPGSAIVKFMTTDGEFRSFTVTGKGLSAVKAIMALETPKGVL